MIWIWIGAVIWLAIAAVGLGWMFRMTLGGLDPDFEDDWVLHDDLGDEN